MRGGDGMSVVGGGSRSPIVLAVQNASLLSELYGADVLDVVGAELVDRIRPLLSSVEGGEVEHLSAGRLAIHGCESDSCGNANLIERVLLEACGASVRLGGRSVVVSIAVLSSAGLSFCSEGVGDLASFGGAIVDFARGEREYLLLDMRRAVDVYDAILDGGVCSLLQQVSSESGGVDNLFHECHVYVGGLADVAGLVPLSEFRHHMRRLGLTRYIDRIVLSEAICRLRENPNLVLVCSISAASAICDAWWRSVFDELEADCSLSERLVVKLNGFADLCEVGPAVSFALYLKMIGCGVAVDYSGSCQKALAFLVASRSDVVFVDARQLNVNGVGVSDVRLTGQLDVAQTFALFGYLVPYLVVSGVDTPGLWELLCRSGAEWFQGAYIGAPSLAEPSGQTWRFKGIKKEKEINLISRKNKIVHARERIMPAAGLSRVSGGARFW